MSFDIKVCFQLMKQVKAKWLNLLCLASLFLLRAHFKKRLICKGMHQWWIYPNVSKLMKKCSYDFKKVASMGHVIEVKPYRIKETQRTTQQQGDVMELPKVGLGYVPFQLARISRWHKDKQSLSSTLQPKRPLKVMRKMLRINKRLLCLTNYNLPLCNIGLRCSARWERARLRSLLFSRY